MSAIPQDLAPIKAFAFDVDGVLSRSVTTLGADGIPQRTGNVKDGFALRMAISHGYRVAVITGGNSPQTRLRIEYLGITDYYAESRDKVADMEHFLAKYGLKAEEAIYVGDDMPDVAVMRFVGIAAAPRDAAYEALDAAQYISPCNGGEGVARDVIEQVMRAQGKWHTEQINLDW